MRHMTKVLPVLWLFINAMLFLGGVVTGQKVYYIILACLYALPALIIGITFGIDAIRRRFMR